MKRKYPEENKNDNLFHDLYSIVATFWIVSSLLLIFFGTDISKWINADNNQSNCRTTVSVSVSLEDDRLSLKEQEGDPIVEFFFKHWNAKDKNNPRPLCSDATIKAQVSQNMNILGMNSNNPYPNLEKIYGIKNLTKIENNKCLYLNENGINQIKDCTITVVSNGNKIFDSIKNKLQEQESISQLDWKQQPEQIKTIELQDFEVIVIEGVQCQEFCDK